MNVDAFLDLEKRSGVNYNDIDSFVNQASDIHDKIRGLVEGTIDPHNPKALGLETDEERAEKERKRLEKLEEIRRKNEELAAKRKEEERERWWTGAELFRSSKTEDDIITDESEEKDAKAKANLKRYTADYSHWDEWKPDDPVSLEEIERLRQEEEKQKNELFEKNNPEFCQQMLQDMQDRTKSIQKKQESAQSMRLRANALFKKGDYRGAVSVYLEALKLSPFDEKILLNIAQSHIKLQAWDDALEFLKRVLFVEPKNVKAHSRKAFVFTQQNQFEEALKSAQLAFKYDSTNDEVITQLKSIESTLNERKVIADINKLKLDIAKSDESPSSQSLSQMSPMGVETGEAVLGIHMVDMLLEDLSNPQTTNDALLSNMTVCRQCLQRNASMKVYMRTSGALKQLITRATDIVNGVKGAIPSEEATLFRDTMETIIDCVSDESASMELLVESGIFVQLRERMETCSNVKVRQGLVRLLRVSVCDECLHRSHRPLLRDSSLLPSLAEVLIQVTEHSLCVQPERCVDEVSLAEQCCEVIAMAAMREQYRAAFAQESVGRCVVAAALLLDVCNHHSTSTSTSILTTAAIKALLTLSQIETMRSHFITKVKSFITNKNNKSNELQSIVEIVIKAIKVSKDSDDASNGIAILLNASVSASDMEIRREIIRCGGLDIALSQLKHGTSDTLSVRKTSLLSRLAPMEESRDRLLTSESFTALCRMLSEPMTETLQSEMRTNAIRTLAALNRLPAHCLGVAQVESLAAYLLEEFPVPRDELGEFTSHSIILTPKRKVSENLLGNAARALMHLAEDPNICNVMFSTKSLICVEKLICAMANCSDIKVRKNIAILLAKGARVPGIREKLTQLRGMQMIVELQDKLLS